MSKESRRRAWERKQKRLEAERLKKKELARAVQISAVSMPKDTNSTTPGQEVAISANQSSSAKPRQRLTDPWHRRLWLAGKVTAVFLVGLAGFVASLYQIFGGPPWPTEPVYSPGPPSSDSPFGIPFDVANKSGVLWIKNIAIKCLIVDVKRIPTGIFKELRLWEKAPRDQTTILGQQTHVHIFVRSIER